MKRSGLISISTIILIFAIAAGCNPSLPSRALVDDLRVLGIRAEPPEAAPGATITFDALVGDVEVPGRAFRRGWALCTPGTEGVATCGDPTRIVALGTSASVSWAVPADFLEGLTAEEAEIGRDVYVVFGIELDGLDRAPDEGEHDISFKRVRISTNPAPNANPRIDALLLDGTATEEPLSIEGGHQADLLVVPSPDSIQEYSLAGDLTPEDMRYTWLVTRGSVGDAVSWGGEGGVSSTSWRAPSSGAAMVWVVLRDGRGGTAWASQPVEIP